ncbi:MAG: mandelate racemase/muconate lactonizing enzyme family protein [Candidatus Berkelbacteria bacterium]|nr:mandelate racemase/muconate lactonizing enzyme family protein [Candidatus Berkelbacteria bacterium]
MNADGLKIEKVETIPLRMALSRTFKGSNYFMTHRCTIITRVYTSEGIIGECYNGDEYETQTEIINIIHQEIEPLIVGMDAAKVGRCWEAMLKPTYNILRNRGLAIQAQACVDSAIWDAIGKALKMPLHRLWGGYRDELPVICIAGYYEEGKTLADLGREMEELRANGYAGCKFKVGGLTPKEDAERVRVARAAAGEDFVLSVDANQGWSARDAIEFAKEIEDCNIRWFEEPCRWYDDRRSMAHVRSVTGIPIAAGQSEMSRNGCRDLIMDGAIDVCNFDASWGGGPSEWLRVAALAKCFSVEMAHHEEPQIASFLLAAITNGTYLETFHPDRDPLFYKLVENRSEFINGMYALNNLPGFGLELDKKVIDKYRTDR